MWVDFVVEEIKNFYKIIDVIVDLLCKERMNLIIYACERAMERGVSV